MHILLDLDGTLVDSRPGIITSIQHSLTLSGLQVPEPDELLWCIGPPIMHSFRKLVEPQPDLFESALATYRARYSETGIFECELYPHIPETLAALREQGHTLHLATSKAGVYAVRIIEHFGLTSLFSSVDGSELDGTRADKAELISHILERENIPTASAYMVGDREHDIIGAVRNGIPGIGALWGYGSGAELMSAGATACVRVPSLLPETIETLLPH